MPEGRCEYTAWDREDQHMVYVCSRPAERVQAEDGCHVHACGYHRPWVLAMRRVMADNDDLSPREPAPMRPVVPPSV